MLHRFTTYHTHVSGGYDDVPPRAAPYAGEVPVDRLGHGDWKEDAEIIFGHAWPGRADGRWHAHREGYRFHSMERTSTGIVFKVDSGNRPGYYMWIDGYPMSGPW